MPTCRDSATAELSKRGYNLIRYPRPGIAPLDIVAGERSPLQWLGPITDVWTGKLAPPTYTESNAPSFGAQRSGSFRGSLGVKILQGLLRNIGGDVASDLSVSSSLSFAYENPTRRRIDPTKLGAYLKEGDLDIGNVMIKRYLKIDNAIESRFYIITEVLTARKLIVQVSGSANATASVDAIALQTLLSSNASVDTKNLRTSEVSFDGAVDLTFAFQAYELSYDDEQWRVIGTAENEFLADDVRTSPLGTQPITIT